MPEEREEKKATRRRRDKPKRKSELGGILGLLSLIIIVIFLLLMNKSGGIVAGISTKGKTQEKIDPGVKMTKEMQDSAQERLEKIKEQVQNLSVSDMVTSSPQVEKIMQDLRNLQNPKNQVKDACRNICEGL